jgi:hypothetical protein
MKVRLKFNYYKKTALFHMYENMYYDMNDLPVAL